MEMAKRIWLKWWAILFAGLLLVGYPTLSVRSTSAAAMNQFTVAVIVGINNNPFYYSLYQGAAAAGREMGVKVTWNGAEQWDVSKQTLVLDGVIARKPDAILIAPTDRQAMINPIQRAINAGIKVVTVDTDIESDIVVSNVASDNRRGGEVAGEALAKLIGGKGKVALMGAMQGVSTNEERYTGFRDALKKYPDIQLVTTQYSNESQSQATAQMQAVLAGHTDLAGAFAVDTPTTHGVAVGLKNAGKQGKFVLVGFDAQPLEIEDIKGGILSATVAQAPYAMGYVGMQIAVDTLRGFVTKWPRQLQTGFLVITPQNVSNPETANWIYSTNQPK
jgi:ribose transport system substrate-binding protein